MYILICNIGFFRVLLHIGAGIACNRRPENFGLQQASGIGLVGPISISQRLQGVIHERALSPAELFGGKTPAGA